MAFKTFKTISIFLQKLGLSQEESEIYLALVGKDQLTADQIAKTTKIPKTNIYRRLESLHKIGLVEQIIEEKKILSSAASPELLAHLVSKKEDDAKVLHDLLPFITQNLVGTAGLGDQETKVLFYRGKDGIEQMWWNALRAKGEVVGYTYRTGADILGPKSALKWNEEWKETGIKIRDLYSDEFLKSKVDPKIEEPGDWTNSESRYIPSKILNINHQMDIYNDVVGIYNWHEGEVFGVEIHNSKVASMQKQIFEILWQMAQSKVTE